MRPRPEHTPAVDHDDQHRPLEGRGKLLGDVPSATAILDRFLHHAETITGKSYRLREEVSGKKPSGNAIAFESCDK